jgi:hypothetical membrane protein
MLHRVDYRAAGPRHREIQRPERAPVPMRRHIQRQLQRQRWQLRRRIGRRWALHLAAFALVLFALLAPNRLGNLSPATFVRIPVEGLFGVALVLLLPRRAMRPLAAVAGVVLSVLTIGKILDMGFFATLSRPFDPLADWTLLSNASEFVATSAGRTADLAATGGAILLTVAVVVLLTSSVVRLTHVVSRHARPTAVTVTALTVIWALCAGLGISTAPGDPVAAADTFTTAIDRAEQVNHEERAQETFATGLKVDPARTLPTNQLLTGLRGKDVVFTFVESYGRVALEDPQMAPMVDKILDDGTRQLKAKGFASRSAFLTSPMLGGGSWMAQATLMTGMWVTNQQLYNNLIASNRLSLNRAFHTAGWRTVGVMPGIIRAWPEGAFYGFDQVYDAHHLGYRGPQFTWSRVPDQFTLSSFQKLEMSKAGRGPIMVDMPLTSSHIPWAPLPKMVDWNGLGDGKVFGPIAAAGEKPDGLLQDPPRLRIAYRNSVEYTLTALLSYVQKYGNDNLVMVFMGDHQPSPLVVGPNASHGVPITIVARDPAVMKRIASWGWQDGLRPQQGAPVWRMDSFRDRFLKTFSG